MTRRHVSPLDLHPDDLRQLLTVLSPDRLPLPWDSKVERLINGLKDPHLYMGQSSAGRVPWLLHRKLLRNHAHFLGGRGSGRTNLGLLPLIIQLIARADSSVCILDLMGDRALFWSTFVEAARAGLRFRWFTIEPGAASFAFSPFTQRHNQERTVNARAQSLLTALGLYYGDAYLSTHYRAITLDTLTAFLRKFRDIRSFVDLARYAEERASYVATKTDQENSPQLRMMARHLAAVEPLNITESSPVRPEVLRDAIDMSDVLTQKQVVYFFLPSMEEELTAKSIAKLALYSLVHAAKILNRTQQTVPVYAVVDELQQVCAENIKILVEMARSVHLILSHQDLSQLKTAQYDNQSTIESCTTLKYVLEASSYTALKQMEKYSGEARERTVSWSQAIHAGFDENDDDALTPDRAYPKDAFDLATATIGEVEKARLSRNEILAISAHPLRGFVRSRSDSGLTQYAGQWTPIECEFPITIKEYTARSNTPLPREHPSCLTVSVGEPEDGDGLEPVPQNNPLPVPPSSGAVDKAIAERLDALQDTIRNQRTPEKSEKGATP